MRNHMEEMTLRCIAQPLLMKRRWSGKAPLHDRAVANARYTVANCAINVVTFLSLFELFQSHCHRKTANQMDVYFARVKEVIIVRVSSGDYPADQRTRGVAIREKWRFLVRLQSRVIPHFLSAAEQDNG